MKRSLQSTLLLLLFIVVLLLAPVLLPEFYVTLLNYIGLYAIVALGLVMLTGVGGLTSFGQAAFVGLGAYTSAYLTTVHGVSPWLTLPAGLLVTGVVALSLGLVVGIRCPLSGDFGDEQALRRPEYARQDLDGIDLQLGLAEAVVAVNFIADARRRCRPRPRRHRADSRGGAIQDVVAVDLHGLVVRVTQFGADRPAGDVGRQRGAKNVDAVGVFPKAIGTLGTPERES